MSAAITIERFEAEHILELANTLGSLTWHDRKVLARVYEQAAGGFTARRPATGEILFCGGFDELHPQRARMWAVYGLDLSRREWAALLQRTQRYIANLPHRRVEAEVAASEVMHQRWADSAGLKLEGRLIGAAPDGSDMLMMARIERLGGQE